MSIGNAAVLPPEQRPPAFRVGPTRSGFLGGFSAVALERGTLVLCEQPLFTVDAPLQSYLYQRSLQGGSGPTPVQGDDDEEEEAPAADLETFLDRNIRRLLALRSPQQREAFWNLANSHPELPRAYGIFATNAVSTVEETGGLFLQLSRLNSSCRPNLSRPLYDPKTRSFSLYALQDIPVGEELTWPYLGVPFDYDAIDARQAEMQRVFGFTCTCDACHGWATDVKSRLESEQRLLRLRRLKEGLAPVRGGREWTLGEMARLSREERLWEVADRLEEQVRLEGARLA